MSFGRIYHPQGSSFRNINNRRSSSNERNTRDSSAKYNAVDHGNNFYAPDYYVPYGWNLNFRDCNFTKFDNAKLCESQPLKRRKFSDSAWEGCGNYYHQFNAYESAPSIKSSHLAEHDYVHDPSTSSVCTVASSNKRDRSKLEDEDTVFNFMSKDQIERCSPSRKDGIDALREKHLRYSYCAFLRYLGFRLDLPQKTIATAMVLCHRFFVRRSHACHDRYLIATATLFLAAKSEESARPLNNVLRASCEILQKQDLYFPSCTPPVDSFDQYRERVLDAEQLVLATLDFELNMQHPHVPLTSVLNKLGLAQSVLVNLALHLLSEGFWRRFLEFFHPVAALLVRLRSSLWLQFKPHQIAAGAVYLAAKFLNWDLTALQYVWKEFQATPGVLQEHGYSVALPEKLSSGKWNVHRSARSPLKLISRFPNHPEIGTLHDNFVQSVESFQDYKYLGTRVRVDGTVGEYKWMTYGEAGTARTALGSGLIYHGISKGSCIGLYFINRPEWMIVDHACSAYSYISVPLYDTLGPDAAKYIINHAAIQAIFCVPQTLNSLLSFLSEIPTVRLIVVVGGIDDQMPSLPSTSGVEIISYSKLLGQGRSNLQPFCPPRPEDIATICYTSGTTGIPKGAALTHENLIANVAGTSIGVKFCTSDVYISYLPLAHIYERANQVMTTYAGVAVGFYQGDNLKLMDDIATLRPTIFCSVPRLYNRIYDGIINAVKTSGGLRERLFNAAFNAKKQAIMNGKPPSPMWDRLVFNKIKDKLGGRVRLMCSGASPLSPDVMDFLKVIFGCRIAEGYGMTETACVITSMDESDLLSGHVGSPNPACEVKLVDVPEMNYTSDDEPFPRGEICVRGPIIFKGYYKDETQTREVIDEDGWLHTGDIGMWISQGRLKIIDRKKNIFKLAQGEYIAPEKIENVYTKCKFVGQCFVYGDSLNSSLVAIVSVDPDVLKAWAVTEGIKHDDLGQLCNDPKVRAAVLADMDAVGREAKLRGFEFAKAVTLVPEPFTMENGLLTPTFKVKRPQAKEYFAKAIADMYAEIAASEASPRSML